MAPGVDSSLYCGRLPTDDGMGVYGKSKGVDQ